MGSYWTTCVLAEMREHHIVEFAFRADCRLASDAAFNRWRFHGIARLRLDIKRYGSLPANDAKDDRATSIQRLKLGRRRFPSALAPTIAVTRIALRADREMRTFAVFLRLPTSGRAKIVIGAENAFREHLIVSPRARNPAELGIAGVARVALIVRIARLARQRRKRSAKRPIFWNWLDQYVIGQWLAPDLALADPEIAGIAKPSADDANRRIIWLIAVGNIGFALRAMHGHQSLAPVGVKRISMI